VNPGQKAFYRVKYSNSLLQKLQTPIQGLKLSAADRIGIIGDAMALSQAGMLDTASTLQLVEYYANEDNYTVWAEISSKLGDLDLILTKEKCYPKFETFNRKVYSKIVEKVGWDKKDNEDHVVSLLRPLVIGRAGKYGDTKVVEESRKRFQEFLKSPNSLSPDLRGVVFRTILGNPVDEEENTKNFDTLVDLNKKAEMHEEKERYQESVGAVAFAPLLKRALEFSISSEVRNQDVPFVIARIAANNKGRDIAWEFVKSNWDDLQKRFEGGFLIGSLLKSTAGSFADEEKAVEIEKFFEGKKVPGAERTIKQIVERVRSNSQWLARDRDSIAKFLDKY